MLKVILSISVLAFCFMIITSCATQKTQTNPSSLPEEATDKEEKDRGFDPCLVNPKLPACKKKSG